MQQRNISFVLVLVLILVLVCLSKQDEITVTTEPEKTVNVPVPETEKQQPNVQQQPEAANKESKSETNDEENWHLSPMFFAAPRFPSLLSSFFNDDWDMFDNDDDWMNDGFFGMRYRQPSLFTRLRNQLLRRRNAAEYVRACNKKQQQQQQAPVDTNNNNKEPAPVQDEQTKQIKVASEWLEQADAYKITISLPTTVTRDQVQLTWNKQKRVLHLQVGDNLFQKEYRLVKPIHAKQITAQWNQQHQLVISVPKKSTTVPITIQHAVEAPTLASTK